MSSEPGVFCAELEKKKRALVRGYNILILHSWLFSTNQDVLASI